MFDKVTKSIRVLSAASVEKANSGHPGMPMGNGRSWNGVIWKYTKYFQ